MTAGAVRVSEARQFVPAVDQKVEGTSHWKWPPNSPNIDCDAGDSVVQDMGGAAIRP